MKRTLFVALTALAMAMIAPASQADRYSHGPHYGHHGYYRSVYVQPEPVYERPRNCYRTTVVRRGRSSAPIVAGGVIGGMIGNDIGHGRRGPTIAGTVIGALVVDKLTRGHRRTRIVSRVVCD
jgi:uncharacterized protein YcfJ